MNVPWGSESLVLSDNISWNIRCLNSLLSLSLWWFVCCAYWSSMFCGSSFDSEFDFGSYAFDPKYDATYSSSSLPETIRRQWCTDVNVVLVPQMLYYFLVVILSCYATVIVQQPLFGGFGSENKVGDFDLLWYNSSYTLITKFVSFFFQIIHVIYN